MASSPKKPTEAAPAALALTSLLAKEMGKDGETDSDTSSAREPERVEASKLSSEATPPPELPASAPAGSDAEANAAGETTLLGVLDGDQRIRRSAEQNERTLWTGAALATLVYVLVIAGPMIPGVAALLPAAPMQKERRGQDANTISVEIVPEPDPKAKTPRWREGAASPAPQPTEQPPQPPQTAALQQPEAPEAKEEEEPTKDPAEPRPDDGSPMMLDIDSLVDAAAADLKRKIDQTFAKRPPKREKQQVISGGDMQVRGSGASGKSNPFTKSVIAALMKTRPGPFTLWGRVLVSFQVGESVELKYVHMLHSSGNSALDDAAVEAIRKARFEVPPPGLSPEDRTYIIDYIFG